MSMNYLQAFQRSARCFEGDVALVEAAGRRVTYGELDAESTALANATTDAIGAARCATLALNSVATVASMIAGQKRGCGTVQLPFRAGPDELADMLTDADADGVLFDDANADLALDLLDRADVDLALAVHAGDDPIDDDRVVPYEDFLAGADRDTVAEQAGDEYGVFYTSGTTSKPKGVPFDQEQMWLGAAQVVMEMGIEPTDTALVTTPWYHMVSTDAWILPHLHAGATLVLQPTFDPPESLRLIEEHDVTGILAVPTQLKVLASEQAETGRDVDSLSYIRTGGSIVSAQLVEAATEHLTENVYNSYGMTEGGPNLTYAHPSAQAGHTGTVGKASFVWDLRVVESVPPAETPDPTAEVAPGETGEILVRGPGMTRGYLDNPEAEADLFVGDWLRTHDVADVDEDGYLYIVDRVDNMIVSGGENVYPQEVEQAILERDGVDDAAVVGLPDDHWGELVACVVSTTADLTEDDLDRFCRDHGGLANFKRPRRYVFTEDALPRTDTGTLERQRVVDEFFD